MKIQYVVDSIYGNGFYCILVMGVLIPRHGKKLNFPDATKKKIFTTLRLMKGSSS